MTEKSNLRTALFTQHEVLQIMEEHRNYLEQQICQHMYDYFGRDVFSEFNQEMQYDVFLSSYHTEQCKNIIKRHYRDIVEDHDYQPQASTTSEQFERLKQRNQTVRESLESIEGQTDMWGEFQPTGQDILSAIRSRKEKSKDV